MSQRMRKATDRTHSDAKDDDDQTPSVTLGERLSHTTFAQYTMPMSTGGVAMLMYSVPYQFTGLNTIGKIIFISGLVSYVAISAGIIFRFTTRRGTLRLAFTHPTESLFFPALLLAFVVLLVCTVMYGVPACGPWLVVVIRIFFWIYTAVAFVAAVLQYWFLFSAKQHLTIQSMTPAWILPAFSTMVIGVLAATLLPTQPDEHKMTILIAGLTFLGFGWCVAFLMFGLFLSRLMQYGLPAPDLRPGMFIAAGPPSFIAVALIQMSNNLPADYGYFAAHPSAVDILQVLAVFMAIFLWALAFWFWCIAAISVLVTAKGMKFHLVWWSLVFPNVGFTIATTDIGRSLDSPAILWVGTAMTIIFFCVWLVVLYFYINAIVQKDIMMPGKDEDKDAYRHDDEKHGIFVPP